MKSTATGGSLPYLLLWERPEPLFDLLFPMMHENTHFRRVPAYVEEVQKGFKRGHIEAQCPSQNERTDQEEIMIYLQAQSD